MKFGHYHDDHDTICCCADGPQIPIIELLRQSVPSVVRDGLVMNPHDAAIVDEMKTQGKECGVSIEHLAEPGDLHCQRCGVELSIEDGARINQQYWETDEFELYVGHANEQQAQAQRHAWSAAQVTKKYAETMAEGPWQDNDPEPSTYKIMRLADGWWSLRCMPTDTDVVKAHGPGAKEEITERWNLKTALWLAWRQRQRG
jgi:hypothetical protein